MKDCGPVSASVSPQTLEFHRRSLVIDLHTDSLIAARMLGRDLSRRHRPPRGLRPWMLHADVPKLAEGGVDGVFLGIVTHPWPRRAYQRANRAIDYSEYVLRKNRPRLKKALRPEDIEQAKASGNIAVLLGVEGMHMLGGKVERIAKLYQRGVRYITMAHFTSNRFAASSADPFARNARLGPLGCQAVEMMNEMGMMIDVSHTHSDIIAEVCRRSNQPVIVSHGATKRYCPVFRNLSDTDVRNIAATGGVIGLIYASNWLASDTKAPGLGVVVDHADHVRKLVGVDHLALGSDWDGCIKTPRGMRDASELPHLTQLFFDRGYGEDEVAKILGLNFMRVFREVSGQSTS